MDSDDNWDLFAVVRGCRSSATRDPLSPLAPRAPVPAKTETEGAKGGAFMSFGDCLDGGVGEPEEMCRPFFFPNLGSVGTPSVASIVDFPSTKATSALRQQQMLAPCRQTQRSVGSGQISRSKRRKLQQNKVVCNVPAESLSSDIWAWRKYGQKPIKGSPYPRGYYRCSSSKTCPARKQVERNRTDPNTFIVTYTSEHNHAAPAHRNALAGVSRPKNSAGASPVSSSTSSPTTTLAAAASMDGDDDGDFDDEGMVLEMMGEEDDLVFVGDEIEDFSGEGEAGGAVEFGDVAGDSMTLPASDVTFGYV